MPAVCDVTVMAAARLKCCLSNTEVSFKIVLGLLLLAQKGVSNEVQEASLPVTTVVSPHYIHEKTVLEGNVTDRSSFIDPQEDEKLDVTGLCPSALECSKLGGECINCTFNKTCVYGEEIRVTCIPLLNNYCLNNTTFNRTMICRYCYQVETWEQTCQHNSNCIVSNPRKRYLSNCTVKSDVICLGNRTFGKYLQCNWTAGYKWTTALILSITLGGFGADRFYLGHWQEGIGKLFSFGGLGVWTLLDVILIAVGYLGPADGSLYIW